MQFVQGLSWPFVGLILGTFALLVFRKPIESFLWRLRSANKDGLTTESPLEAQVDKRREEEIQKLMDVESSPVLLQQETLIKSDLEGRGLQVTGETSTLLIRQLAAAQLLLAAEQVYNVIFGSQIFLLKMLNQAGNNGHTVDTVKAHFDRIQQFFPTFKEWSLSVC